MCLKSSLKKLERIKIFFQTTVSYFFLRTFGLIGSTAEPRWNVDFFDTTFLTATEEATRLTEHERYFYFVTDPFSWLTQPKLWLFCERGKCTSFEKLWQLAAYLSIVNLGVLDSSYSYNKYWQHMIKTESQLFELVCLKTGTLPFRQKLYLMFLTNKFINKAFSTFTTK